MSRYNPAAPSPFARRSAFGVGRAATAFSNRVRMEAESHRLPIEQEFDTDVDSVNSTLSVEEDVPAVVLPPRLSERRTMLPAPVLPTAKEDMERIRKEAGYDSDDDFFEMSETSRPPSPSPSKNPLPPSPPLTSSPTSPLLSDSAFLKAVSSIESVEHGLKSLIERETIKTATTTVDPVLSNDDFHTFTIKVPRLSKRTNIGWKLTWLGLILAIFSAWYLAESIACGFYCKPKYATGATRWYPGAPTFGLALPYKLDDMTGEVISRTWHVADQALGPRRFRMPVRGGYVRPG